MFGKWNSYFENNMDVLVPEFWVRESLYILRNNVVMPYLVNRDYENIPQRYGQVINAHLPGSFIGATKGNGAPVVKQSTSVTSVPIVLNKHAHVSFPIYDLEGALSLPNLVDTYIEPAAIALANKIDAAILGECYNFTSNVVGQLGVSPTKDQMIEAREKLSDQGVPMSGRVGVLSTSTEASFLKEELFTAANKRGSSDTINTGELGRIFNIDWYMDQNVSSIASGSNVRTGAVNNSAGYSKGSTSINIDGVTGSIITGSWVTIAGDMTPQKVVSSTGGATPTNIVITPGLNNPVANNAVLTVYTTGAIDNAAGYKAKYGGDLSVDGFGSVSPKVGQMITLSDGSSYSVIEGLDQSGNLLPTATSIELSSGLNSSVANNDVLGLGPAGTYNPVFHRNAITFASRPLAMLDPGVGAKTAVGSIDDIPLRVTISYDGSLQAHLVTLDVLFGTSTLNKNMGCLILS